MIIEHNFDLTPHNSYRLKATAERAFFPATHEDIERIFSDTSRQKIILGGGCNIVFSKPCYPGIDFILLDRYFANITFNSEIVIAQAGACLKNLSEQACQQGLSGLEVFFDIPGTLGGAVCMNAGPGDECIGNLVSEVTYFDCGEKVFKTMKRDAVGFGYRASWFLDRSSALITDVRLKLSAGNPATIQKKMIDTQVKRRKKQPWEMPNAGSVFKRPPGQFVGKIIDQLELKGTTIGGAQISTKHGGFIVNYNGRATGQDVVGLIRFIQAMAAQKLNVTLEMEQRII